MPDLSEHFRQSGYAIHRGSLRKKRLPACCRTGLSDCGMCVKYLDCNGEETLLPLQKCAVCGRLYALCGDRFMPIDNPLRAEFCSLPEDKPMEDGKNNTSN